jgi:hypothetical protein
VILLTCGCSLEAVSGTRGHVGDGAVENTWDSGSAEPDGGKPSGIAGDAAPADASVSGADAMTRADAAPLTPPPDGSTADAASVVPDAGRADGGPGSFTPPPGDVGAPCDQASDCNGLGNTCLTSVETDDGPVTVPNGYCTRTCNVLPCGNDAVCTESKVCARTCERDSDCRADEGYACRDDVCTLPGLSLR